MPDKKNNPRKDINEMQDNLQLDDRKDEDFFDFNFHDMKKSYTEFSPEYQKYRDCRNKSK